LANCPSRSLPTISSDEPSYESQAIRAGEEPRTRLEFQQHGDAPDSLPAEGYVVATTGRYMFFYEAETGEVRVIPIGAVRQILTPGHRANPKPAPPA